MLLCGKQINCKPLTTDSESAGLRAVHFTPLLPPQSLFAAAASCTFRIFGALQRLKVAVS